MRRGRLIATAFWAAVFLWLTCGFVSVNRTAQALLPKALEYGDAAGDRLRFSELYAAEAKVEGLLVSGESSGRGLVYAADFPLFEGLVRIVPVSYTHLDVYKRQRVFRSGIGDPGGPGPSG